MANGLASLLSQPMAGGGPAPGDAGSDGRDQAGGGSLQSMLQQPQGQQGVPQGGPPAPNAQQTTAAVRHLLMFQQYWKRVLSTPNIGKADIKGAVLEVMADAMGERLVTLPQVMSELKALPPDPLGQRQWVEEHYRKAEQAAVMILQHHAAANPRTGLEPPPDFGGEGGDHTAMMGGLVDHYRQRSPKGRG